MFRFDSERSSFIPKYSVLIPKCSVTIPERFGTKLERLVSIRKPTQVYKIRSEVNATTRSAHQSKSKEELDLAHLVSETFSDGIPACGAATARFFQRKQIFSC